MKKKILIVAALLFTGFFTVIPGQEETKPDSLNLLVKEIRRIWPNGNCAENLSGNKKFIIVSLACSGDYTSKNRNIFLKTVLGKGWNVEKETYRIDPNSAGYFYKFSNNKNKYFYVKLFFRNPLIVWPVHENHRPKIAILVNNVKDVSNLDFWETIKLPLSVSINIEDEKSGQSIKRAEELNYDKVIFFPIEEEKSIEAYLMGLKSYPEENFPFSALTILPGTRIIKETKLARELINNMKLFGVNKIISPNSLEITDTAKVLDIKILTSVYYLGINYEANKTSWNDAYNHAKKNGYSIVVINADDQDSRSFLISNISESMKFIDFVKITDLPVSENLF
jgi:hypothetical protein